MTFFITYFIECIYKTILFRFSISLQSLWAQGSHANIYICNFDVILLLYFLCYLCAPKQIGHKRFLKNWNFFGRITREFSVYGWLSLEILFSDGNIHDIESKIRRSSSDFHRKQFYFEAGLKYWFKKSGEISSPKSFYSTRVEEALINPAKYSVWVSTTSSTSSVLFDFSQRER